MAELLFVHPVGNAVDDGVAPSVVSHLHLGVAALQVDQEDVTFTHEGHPLTVGREQRRLLRSAVRERYDAVVLHRVDVVTGCQRAPIDAVRFRLQQQTFAVRTHAEVLHPLQSATLHRCRIEECGGLLSRFERIFHDAPSAVLQTGIRLAVSHRHHAAHRLAAEFTPCNVLQFQLCSPCGKCCQQCCRYHDNQSFH